MTLALLWLGLIFGSTAHGQFRQSHNFVPHLPEDMAQVDFYLLTTATGPRIADRFGHTGIRVHDLKAGTDVVYNWGKFDFNAPGFAWKFFRGELTYSMGVRTFRRHVAIYEYHKRSVWQEKLNLTVNQKRKLMEKIAWNSIPGNRKFQYQYWYRNCATIPRDYLNRVLEGAIRAKFYNEDAGITFRDYVRTNLRLIPGVELSLDILMNGNIDRPITTWEEMFLPAKLREHLKRMPRIDDVGNPIPGTKLLGPTVQLVDHPEFFARTVDDYTLAGLLLWGPMLLGAFAFRRRNKKGAYRSLGLAMMAWGAFAGIFGSVLLFNWIACGHPDSWANVNLLLFFPVDWAFVVLGWRMFKAGGPIKDRLFFMGAGRLLCYAHIGAVVVLAGLYAGGVVTQDVSRLLLWYGSFALVVTGVFVGKGFAMPGYVAVDSHRAREAAKRQVKGRGRRYAQVKARR